jgi:hypothetical protein
MRYLCALSVAALLLAAAPGRAAEMGLDLSDGVELRPTLAVLGISVPKDVAAADKAHAEKLATALVAASRKTNWFAKVLDPSETVASLKDRAAAAADCSNADCLADIAHAAGTDRVLAAQMEFPEGGPVLKIHGFDLGTNEVEEVVVEAQGKPQSFDRNVAAAFKPLLLKISTALGTLKVVPSVAGASVEVVGRSLGTGTVEKQVPAGTLKVKITAPDYLPFEAEVAVQSKGTAELNAQLAPKPVALPPPVLKPEPEPVLVVKPPSAPSKPFYARPGLYVGVVGVAAAAVGLVFGLNAKSIEKKANESPSGGIVGVTRLQMLDARRNSKIATGLMAGGGGLFAAGVLWFSLEPVFATSTRSPGKEPTGPAGSEPTALLLNASGEF